MKKGITVVEVLIVISVIGLLTCIAMSNFIEVGKRMKEEKENNKIVEQVQVEEVIEENIVPLYR